MWQHQVTCDTMWHCETIWHATTINEKFGACYQHDSFQSYFFFKESITKVIIKWHLISPRGTFYKNLYFTPARESFQFVLPDISFQILYRKIMSFIRRQKIKDFLFSYYQYKIQLQYTIQYKINPNYYDHISHIVIENWLIGNKIMTYDLLSDSISKITNTEEEKRSKNKYQISYFWVLLLLYGIIFSFSSFPGTLAIMKRKVEILRTPMWVTAISIVTIKNWPANVRGELLWNTNSQSAYTFRFYNFLHSSLKIFVFSTRRN